MTVRELLRRCATDDEHFQLHVNEFLDAFRGAAPAARTTMVAEGPVRSGRLEGLVAAIVSALCHEAGGDAPSWVRAVHSPEPFFVFPARGFALRVRLMLESPAPFRTRNVFVPENYLTRA